MLGVLAGVVLFGNQVLAGTLIPEPGKAPARIMLYVGDERLDPPKISPKQKWMFEWMVKGYAQLEPDTQIMAPRIRVFSQQHKVFDDPAPVLARMAMRLWEINYYRLRTDHANKYNGHVVDIYLCYGGKAGGEQLFGEDDEGGRPHPVNTVYIYDLNSFSSPVEMAREVAHEYGHATLTPIGGYQVPEYWANGYLGEKLYLRMLRDELAAKRYAPADVMGASLQALNHWVKLNVDPLVLAASARAPSTGLKGKGKAQMDAGLGLILYADTILPENLFARTLATQPTSWVADYPKTTLQVVAENSPVKLKIPALLARKAIWVPLGNGSISGADVLEKQDGWAKVLPKANTPVVLSGSTFME